MGHNDSNQRYKDIFNAASVAIMEEDCSEVITAVKRLKAEGIRDFKKYFDDNPDFVHKAARMVKILDVNDATLKLYGAKNKTELLTSLDNIFTASSFQVLKKELVAMAEGERYFVAEDINRTLQGRPFHILLTVTLPQEESEFKNRLAVIIDITERKRMEDELLRTQKLESLAILAGGIAHDFNNVLTGILGSISLAKMRTPSDDTMLKTLTEAEKGCFRARELTQQLITFARGGAPVKKTLSLIDLIKESTTFTLSGSGTKPEFYIADDLWPADVDEGQISQVINNLVLNADQAMPRGGIIKITCENIQLNAELTPLQKGKYVKIMVKDHGIGIPKENLHRIFDPYFTTKQKGSGLGLTTTYSIINKHNGHISVESELGKGTTFSIFLPASEKEPEVRKDIKEEYVIRKGRILIMDDDAIVRDVAGKMLTTLGYEVDYAEDGTSAIEQYKKAKETRRPFDTVIMDLTIPGGMGGKEAITKLLAIDPVARVIVSSGYSSDPVMSEYKRYGFSGVVTKPYTLAELSRVVSGVIKGKD